MIPRLELLFGVRFDVDICADLGWSRLPNYISDALGPKRWNKDGAQHGFENPPYGKPEESLGFPGIGPFISRTIEEVFVHKSLKTTTLLLPNGTSTKWFAELMDLPEANRSAVFGTGRIPFISAETGKPCSNSSVESVAVHLSMSLLLTQFFV
jgi:hypothetical protein